MNQTSRRGLKVLCLVSAMLIAPVVSYSEEAAKKPSSYSPVVITEDFNSVVSRMKAAKPDIQKRQNNLLNERYDLSNYPASGVTMSRGKAVQDRVRVKLPSGVSWDKLASMTPEEIKEKNVFPAGFFPLPHPSWRSGIWMRRNPWFESDVVPALRAAVRKALGGSKT